MKQNLINFTAKLVMACLIIQCFIYLHTLSRNVEDFGNSKLSSQIIVMVEGQSYIVHGFIHHRINGEIYFSADDERKISVSGNYTVIAQ